MSEYTVFLDLPEEISTFDVSKVVVVPVPFEASTSYGKGTAEGPLAIIEASYQVELWDEELKKEPCEIGVYTDDAIDTQKNWDEVALSLTNKSKELLNQCKFPFFLGGEHSITAPIVEGFLQKYPDISVLHFDAHADLRFEYQDRKWSHACVMRRVHEMGIPFCSIGIRSFSKEESDLMAGEKLNIFFAHHIRASHNTDWMDEAISKLSKNVYVTFDIDAVDISEVRATGTPEPGGLYWTEVITFLKKLSASGKNFVGADLVELAPSEHDHTSSFYAAKLAYKMISYLVK